MRNLFRSAALCCVMLLIGPSSLLAQDSSCPDIVKRAVDVAQSSCETTGSNQACYGNVTIDAEASPGVIDFNFDNVGDITNLRDLQSMRLTSQIEESGDWGISLMYVSATLPDDSQVDVQFVVFGEVQLDNAGTLDPANFQSVGAPDAMAEAPVLTLEVNASSNLNLRAGPSTSFSIVGKLRVGDAVVANGRNSAGDWLHVLLEDGQTAWVYSSLVTFEGDINAFPVVEGEGVAPATESADTALSHYGALQAFYVRTGDEAGLADRPCEQAPDSGVLIQTPQGIGEIAVIVNEVVIDLGSTAYIQAQPLDDMIVSVIDGRAKVTASGVSVTVPAGARVRIPMDANLAPAGPPNDPEPYDQHRLLQLPVGLLSTEIAIAPSAEPFDGTIMPGEWDRTTSFVSTCADSSPPEPELEPITVEATTAEGFVAEQARASIITVTNPSPDVFILEWTVMRIHSLLEYRFISSRLIEFHMTTTYEIEGCQDRLDGAYTYIGQ